MKKPLDVTPVIHTFAGNNYRTTFHGFCCLSAADCWPDTKSDVVVHWNIVFYVPCQHSTTIWLTLWVVCTQTHSSQVLHQFQHTLRWWDSSASVTTQWLVVQLLAPLTLLLHLISKRLPVKPVMTKTSCRWWQGSHARPDRASHYHKLREILHRGVSLFL